MQEDQCGEGKSKTTMISVPFYARTFDQFKKPIVHYEVKFSALETGYFFQVPYRYSELRKIHESLETLKVKLPKFPGASWFLSVNSDIKRIEERRHDLDEYFQHLVAIKQVRESFLFKNFIQDSKLERDRREQRKEKKSNQQINEETKLDQQEIKEKRKKKLNSQFITPAIKPSQPPILEQRERALSFEDVQEVKSTTSQPKTSCSKDYVVFFIKRSLIQDKDDSQSEMITIMQEQISQFKTDSVNHKYKQQNKIKNNQY